jgi:hypothetical protein
MISFRGTTRAYSQKNMPDVRVTLSIFEKIIDNRGIYFLAKTSGCSSHFMLKSPRRRICFFSDTILCKSGLRKSELNKLIDIHGCR